MAVSGKTSRFKVNPVELVIFCGVLGFFLFSSWKLFYGTQGPVLSELDKNSSFRSPASKTAAMATISLLCDPAQKEDAPPPTSGVMISGPLCGLPKDEKNTSFSAKVKNLSLTDGFGKTGEASARSSNDRGPTVFYDAQHGTFSTDLIQLIPGENKIEVEFTYTGGRKFKKELVINNRINPEL